MSISFIHPVCAVAFPNPARPFKQAKEWTAGFE